MYSTMKPVERVRFSLHDEQPGNSVPSYLISRQATFQTKKQHGLAKDWPHQGFAERIGA